MLDFITQPPAVMPNLSPNSVLVPLSVYVFPEQKAFLLSLTRGRARSLSHVVRDVLAKAQLRQEHPSLDFSDCHSNQGSESVHDGEPAECW